MPDGDIIELLEMRDEKAIALIVERYEKLIRYISVTILGGREESVK